MLALMTSAVMVGAAVASPAQVSASYDTAQLQFALNLQYLVTNYLQVAIYGAGRQLPADLIRAGETGGMLGVPMTSGSQVAFLGQTRSINARLREIGDESWGRTILLRSLLRADTPAQKLIDLSPAAFTTMFRLAGAIDSAETFNPYASPLNCALAANCLIDVQAGALLSLVPTMTNELARDTIAALAANACSDAATVRSIIQSQSWAQAQPDALTMMDRLAAWRNRISGTGTTDRGLSPLGSPPLTRLALVDADGLALARTPAQALNVLFMNSGAVTQGGFFPTGINGTTVRSAAN
ncbi:ferritin-like domain-containing protein [Sphingomonas sp. GM_Shp_2]|uniref:ferritin-like domain-containing protein n=1 Tax=Sphingomonas sp. GM_Shp_2 TaxID=2937380 RepID=UPI00226A5D97|nr:ferritin-like domain-containing protein [Sphingomonas sp. GM_Shp_2]